MAGARGTIVVNQFPVHVVAALLEWRDARAAFLRCVDTAPHEDQAIADNVSRRFADAEDALFEVAKAIKVTSVHP